MKNTLAISLLLICRFSFGQNLIPNGDFEQKTRCPNDHSQIDTALYWTSPIYPGSSDYYNECASSFSIVGVPVNSGGAGFQYAHSGAAYAGIYIINPGIREYIETPLSAPLTAGTCYQLNMYINLFNNCKYTSDNIGVYFSIGEVAGITNQNVLPFTPQINNSAANYPDTLNWTLVEGNYTAAGDEDHLIIGNFRLQATKSPVNSGGSMNEVYIYIDDVSLIQVPGCETDVTEMDKSIAVELYPNPFTDGLTIKTSNKEMLEVILYDLTSRKILQHTFTNSATLNTELLSKGLYFYELRSNKGIVKTGKIVKQ